ncbi:MAG: class I SAM-dependent RNA methyltransferase [Chloroflexaceae bacterium]|nr:class I SAM-dependent RNA methyltransferase [Chloroflexaceae bacterium]
MRSKEFRKLVTREALRGEEAAPRCSHTGACGGCAFQDRAYPAQVAAKETALGQVWQEATGYGDGHGRGCGQGVLQGAGIEGIKAGVPVVVVPSPDPYAYRTRMDYVTTKGRFGLRMGGRWNYIVELETCHLIPPVAFGGVLVLWKKAIELGLPDYHLRTHEGFLRYLVVRRSPQDAFLIAAVTAAGSYATEMEQLAALALEQPGVVGFHWLRNDTLTDLSFGTPVRHWGAATLPMQVGDHTLHIGPNTFFQNNVHLLLPLLDAVTEAAVGVAPRHPGQGIQVADLYSGVGTIALHLARQVGQVTAAESHLESARLAEQNVVLNRVANVAVVAEEVGAFLRQQPAFRFDCIVADPPRTGLGEAGCAELRRLAPRRIVYVSCNPLTQATDVCQLASAYRVGLLRGYDMFPHTPHVESVAVLDLIPPTS